MNAEALLVKNLHIDTVNTSDRILYDQFAGDLVYDADGLRAGASIKFAQVTDNTSLSYLGFVVV